MKRKKTFLIAAVAVFVASISLSGCGLYNVQSGGTGHYVTSKQFKSVKLGSHISSVLMRFGKPTFTRLRGYLLYYCGKKSKNTSVLYVFNSKNTKKRCAMFSFDNADKNGKYHRRAVLVWKRITK